MKEGFPQKKQEMRKEIAEYWQVRDRLSTTKRPEGTIILMDKRKVIKRAPSQTKLPPVDIENPTKPMQSLCIDFATVGGRRYGIMVDRHTNWPTVWSCRSKTLCSWLADHIKVFGMPEITSTDCGMEFMALDFQTMLKENDIHHRMSSYTTHTLTIEQRQLSSQ